jgi:hypothetical protein
MHPVKKNGLQRFTTLLHEMRPCWKVGNAGRWAMLEGGQCWKVGNAGRWARLEGWKVGKVGRLEGWKVGKVGKVGSTTVLKNG